jgi:hypothetical protein
MKKIVGLIILTAIISSCATHNVMLDESKDFDDISTTEIDQRFYILGNAHGNRSVEVLNAVQHKIEKEVVSKNHVLFTGDNISTKKETQAKKQLDPQIELVKNSGADVYFIPGNYDWKLDAEDGLEVIEDYLEKQLDREDVLTPNNGCPLESISVSEDIQLIAVDSEWYIADWDKLHEINDKCEIKSRKKLMLEIEGEIKKNANKLIIFAIHHPMFTNGFHGGRFSFKDHIFPFGNNIPLPGVGTLIAEIRSQGAISTQDRFNKRYDELMTELSHLLNDEEHRIVLVSGHELNLQYIESDNFKQIVSGAASETRPVSISDDGLFSYGGNGFATLDIGRDGSVWVGFYGASAIEKPLFRKKIFEPVQKPVLDSLPTQFPKSYSASVYEIDKVEKSDFFRSFWGDHYREVYGKKVNAPTAVLDTLYGGLEVVRPGGGHQTKSLRLVTKNGKEYNMRALKKSAVQFLETTTFKGTDAETYFSNTIPEDLILDFYTAAHPYAAFAIPRLAKAAKVYYTTPELFYVPQQKGLGKYNEEYGEQLYMIVERPAEEYSSRKSFGYPDDIESTDDLLKMLREDEENVLDEVAYIRARIFDMLIGDWDRHSDQWRWAVFENEDKKKVFVPIPRDRDQVFANFDGSFLNLLRNVMGSVNQFGVYGPDIHDVKWFNKAGSKLDRALIKRSDKQVWLEQARFLQNAIDEQILNEAFAMLPEEVQDATVEEIKKNFLLRKDNLESIVERYFAHFIKIQVLTGTDKDDHFDIIRKPNGETQINAYRIKDGEKGEALFSRTFNSKETEEVWLYGLDDKDVFKSSGTAKNPVLIRIIGGQEKDHYDLQEGRKIKVYDRRDKDNDIVNKGGAQFRFTNFYQANTYDYQKEKTKGGGIALKVGFNPDDGTVLEAGYTKTVNEFIENPYGRKLEFLINYQFLTQGLDLRLSKSYAAVFSKFNLLLDTRYTSKNYTENFFGFGNQTTNPDDQLSLDYNRVNMEIMEGGVGLETESVYGSFFQLKYDLKTVEVIRNGANIIDEAMPQLFGKRRYFGTPSVTFSYRNVDDEVFPSKGMLFETSLGGIDDLEGSRLTGFAKAQLILYNSLLSNNRLVLKTRLDATGMTGDMPEFYNSTRLGANTGLRGYRAERFTGKHSVLGSADLAYDFKKIKTFFFPLSLSVYGGYDVGRVWIENDNSNLWHPAFGGGIMARWTDALQANANVFTGDEGTRITFGLSFKF